jgi:tetratricopeptide (TPR) repeat protein
MASKFNSLKIAVLLICLSFLNESVHAKTVDTNPPDSLKLINKVTASNLIDVAMKMLVDGRNKDAINSFKEASNLDPENWRPYFYISKGHYNLYNYGYALDYAKKALLIDSARVDKEIYFMLGQSYHRLNKLDSALMNYKVALENLTSLQAKDLHLELRIAQCEFAIESNAKGEVLKRTAVLNINSGYNDYGGMLTNNGQEMYFTSRRNTSTGGQMNPDDQEYFEDIYRAVYNAETKSWDSITNDLKNFNSEAFDALTYISKDGKFGLMTINKEILETDETRSSDLFYIEKNKKGRWSSPTSLDGKNVNTMYFEGSATMTDDRKTIYFVSDRNAERKHSDIYVIQEIDGNWGEATLLPETINTIGRETTPYITPDGQYLFFSSDGFIGMGGLDIYVSKKLENDQWSEPINLGGTINSVNNDTHFYYYPDLNKALISSTTLTGQKGSLDIFEIDMTGFIFPEKK